MERTLELLNTMEEAIFHIQNQLVELRYEEVFVLLQDMMDGITSIENAIAPMESELPENNMINLLSTVKENMDKVLNSYEHDKVSILEKQMSEEVLPSFLNWKEETGKVLRLYIVS